MRIALLSDIHGNLPALEAVLSDLAARADTPMGVDARYHLGDLVGYAPWPNEVVARLRAEGIPGVAGNYDSTVATGYKHCGCRYEDPRQEALSHLSYAWTLEHTAPETKAWLGQLPFRLDVRPLGGHQAGPTLVLVHGAPTLNTLYWTEDRSDGFCRKMAERVGARPGDVMAFGHTHKPWHRMVEGVLFVNTGSVGRPKDGDPRAGYVILDFGVRGEAADVRADVAPKGAADGTADIAANAAADGAPDPAADTAADGTVDIAANAAADGALDPAADPAADAAADPAANTAARATVEVVRVDYDVERAMAAIRRSTLPDAFADYLATGGGAD